MNKKLKLFIKILYYVLTFGLGIILALILPGSVLYENLAQDMNQNLLDGEYDKSMCLIGGYYDKEWAYQETFDDESGVVLFRAMTINQDETPYQAQLCYAGFLYNVTEDVYKTKKLEYGNKTALYVNKDESSESRVEILNYDSNQDGAYDSVNTMVNYKYLYFEILMGSVEEIKSLSFYDMDGNLFHKADTSSKTLDFKDTFFTSLETFKTEFNQDNAGSNLQALEDAFLSQNNNYQKGNYGDAYVRANKFSATVVIIYFVCVYLIADFLVGQHFIIRFIIFIVDKIKRKRHPEEAPNDLYGTDYFTQVTFKLEVDPSVSSDVLLRFSKEDNNEEVVLLAKKSNYELTKRIHAGKYGNLRFESDELEPTDLPEVLEIKGFKIEIVIHAQAKNIVETEVKKIDDEV